jgi:hypothetical protein
MSRGQRMEWLRKSRFHLFWSENQTDGKHEKKISETYSWYYLFLFVAYPDVIDD